MIPTPERLAEMKALCTLLNNAIVIVADVNGQRVGVDPKMFGELLAALREVPCPGINATHQDGRLRCETCGPDADCPACGVRDGHLHENWCHAEIVRERDTLQQRVEALEKQAQAFLYRTAHGSNDHICSQCHDLKAALRGGGTK